MAEASFSTPLETGDAPRTGYAEYSPPAPAQIESLVSRDRWGPMFWDLCHLVSFTFPDNASEHQKEQTARFFESLASVLPCEECKRDFGGMLQRYPVRSYLDSRDSLSRWAYDVHNMVNAKLGKPITVSYEQAKKRYVPCQQETQECRRDLEQCTAAASQQKTANMVLLVFALIALVVGVYLWWSRSKRTK